MGVTKHHCLLLHHFMNHTTHSHFYYFMLRHCHPQKSSAFGLSPSASCTALFVLLPYRNSIVKQTADQGSVLVAVRGWKTGFTLVKFLNHLTIQTSKEMLWHQAAEIWWWNAWLGMDLPLTGSRPAYRDHDVFQQICQNELTFYVPNKLHHIFFLCPKQ